MPIHPVELEINGRPVIVHRPPAIMEHPVEEIDRQLIRVWLGAEVWRDLETMAPSLAELRLHRIANRSRFYRRWKFHLLSRCLARQAEAIIHENQPEEVTDGQG
jgi:hypothetical protein